MGKHCYVHIMANPWSRVLYTGVTGDLHIRVYQHRAKTSPGFTQKYNVSSLVNFEEHEGPKSAIEREKEIKTWLRSKKIALIESVNPNFDDLSAGWYSEVLNREPAGFLQNDVKDPNDRTERR